MPCCGSVTIIYGFEVAAEPCPGPAPQRLSRTSLVRFPRDNAPAAGSPGDRPNRGITEPPRGWGHRGSRNQLSLKLRS